MEEQELLFKPAELAGTEEITEPSLQNAKSFLEGALGAYDGSIDHNARIYDAMSIYANRAYEIMLPNSDNYTDVAATERGVRMVTWLVATGESEEGVFYTHLTSSCETTVDVWAGNRELSNQLQRSAFAKTETAFEHVLELIDGNPEDIALDLDEVKAIIEPSRRLAEVYPGVKTHDEAAIDEYCALFEHTINGGSMGLLIEKAYAGINRFLKNAEEAGRSVGLYTPARREEMKQEHGYTDESLRLLEASQIISLVHVRGDADADDMSRLGYWADASRMLGHNPANGLPPGLFSDGLEYMIKSPATPDDVRQALTAIAVAREVKDLLSFEPYHAAINHATSLFEDGPKHLRQEAQVMPGTFEVIIEGFYHHITTAIEALSGEGFDMDYKMQVLQLEDIMVTELTARMEQGESAPYLSRNAKAELEQLLVPRLRSKAQKQGELARLTENNEFCEASQAQIDQIDQPYLYTSKKIRGFEGGVDTLFNLGKELDKRQMLTNEDGIRQTLAILMLQAENAEDKDLYFMQLKEDRHAIEELLGGISDRGQDGSSRLTDTLRWADEIIDAGLEKKFAHDRLKKFLDNYYLGGEDESLEPEVIAEPVVEALVEVEPVEEDAEPSVEDESQAKEKPNLIDEYFAELKDVLENVEVEFANVKAFPPDGGSRREIKHHLDRASGERFIDIDRNRLKGMVELKADFERMGKSARLIFTQPTKWSKLPYVALYIQEQKDDEIGVCLLENVVNGLATYGFGVDGKDINAWEDLVSIASLKTARDEFGAIPMVHPNKGAENFAQHYSVRLREYAMLELAKVNQA